MTTLKRTSLFEWVDGTRLVQWNDLTVDVKKPLDYKLRARLRLHENAESNYPICEVISFDMTEDGKEPQPLFYSDQTIPTVQRKVIVDILYADRRKAKKQLSKVQQDLAICATELELYSQVVKLDN